MTNTGYANAAADWLASETEGYPPAPSANPEPSTHVTGPVARGRSVAAPLGFTEQGIHAERAAGLDLTYTLRADGSEVEIFGGLRGTPPPPTFNTEGDHAEPWAQPVTIDRAAPGVGWDDGTTLTAPDALGL